MEIDKLPPGLRELAVYRKKQFLETIKTFSSIFVKDVARSKGVSKSFSFRGTPEGLDFWVSVCSGKFEIYNGCKVTNLKRKNVPARTID